MKQRFKLKFLGQFCNFLINPGRGGLFLEVRITHDGCGYVCRTGILSNVTADKGNFERKKRFIGPWKRIAYQAAVYSGMTHKYVGFQKQAPTAQIDLNLLRSYLKITLLLNFIHIFCGYVNWEFHFVRRLSGNRFAARASENFEQREI